MRTQLRIVAGSLRGRRLTFTVDPALRPMPDMVREALFSILGNAVPGRPFYDLFAGTGAVGLEALSRGAAPVTFIERDPRVASELVRNLHALGVADAAAVHRADVYRWGERWQADPEPVTLFLGPPFPDLEHRPEALLRVLATLQERAAPGSVLVLQSEKTFATDRLPDALHWDHRHYGRNQLSFWVKGAVGSGQ
jgi:16S rRNA (guanine(966)-N(2))-methyltransferase RsmD